MKRGVEHVMEAQSWYKMTATNHTGMQHECVDEHFKTSSTRVALQHIPNHPQTLLHDLKSTRNSLERADLNTCVRKRERMNRRRCVSKYSIRQTTHVLLNQRKSFNVMKRPSFGRSRLSSPAKELPIMHVHHDEMVHEGRPKDFFNPQSTVTLAARLGANLLSN